MGKMIYLDNAATTKTAPEVVEAMLPYFTEFYGNASTVYDFAANSKAAIAKGRQQIADVIGAKKEEIYFTAGGSESDNWALKATFEAYKNKGNHIITTKIEHHAILHTCEYLEKERGAKVTYLDVDENGFIDLDELQKAITPETILISVMAANNEIGTLEPLKEIGQIAHEHGILFHTDAVQAFGQIPINVDEFNIDMLSSSGHKINGPKGIGFLYIRKGVKIRSFVHGGAQERKRRAGTENVPGIVGYGLAAERANKSMKERTAKEIEIRDHMINRILTEIPYVRLNGDKVKRLPRELEYRDGKIWQKPVREIENYRKNRCCYENVKVGESLSLEGVRGRMIDLTVELQNADGIMDGSRNSGNPNQEALDVYNEFRIELARNEEYTTVFTYDRKRQILEIDRTWSGVQRDVVCTRKLQITDDRQNLKLRFILDRSSIELFINDGSKTATTVIPTPVEADEILFHSDGNAVIQVEKYDIVL